MLRDRPYKVGETVPLRNSASSAKDYNNIMLKSRLSIILPLLSRCSKY